jgi:hypothetical protein
MRLLVGIRMVRSKAFHAKKKKLKQKGAKIFTFCPYYFFASFREIFWGCKHIPLLTFVRAHIRCTSATLRCRSYPHRVPIFLSGALQFFNLAIPQPLQFISNYFIILRTTVCGNILQNKYNKNDTIFFISIRFI